MVHPSSTNTGLRPPSSLSVGRPPSSASARPLSRISHHRPNSRSHARFKLTPLAQSLVKQVTGFDDHQDVDDAAAYHESVEFVVKNLEATTINKVAARMDMDFIEKTVQGHALKSRIGLKDELGKALETCMKDIRHHMETRESDLDDEIQISRIPDHLQLLLALSNAPSRTTEAHASLYLHNRSNPSAPADKLTWASIVAEEPFEGEHWEGVYGLPPGFVRRAEPEDSKWFYDKEKERDRIDFDSRWSTPSLSPLNSDDLELDEDQERELAEQGRALYDATLEEEVEQVNLDALERSRLEQQAMIEEEVGLNRHPPADWTYRMEFEELQKKQYWIEGHQETVASVEKVFNIGNPSTLAPALNALQLSENSARGASKNLEFYIDEDDAVREVLMALQGRKNVILEWKEANSNAQYIAITPMPRLRHLSPGAQLSIISSLAGTATAVEHLRHFVKSVVDRANSSHDIDHSHGAELAQLILGKAGKTTQTIEAFADAVQDEIILFDKYCASREEAICRAWGGGGSLPGLLCDSSDGRGGLVVNLLSTERDIRDRFERIFRILLDVVRDVLPEYLAFGDPPTRRNGSAINFSAATSANLLDELLMNAQNLGEQEEVENSKALTRVFVHTAEPLWASTIKWLRDGMAIHSVLSADNHPELEEEFFIESNGVGLGMMGMGLLDPEFWKEGYAIRDEALFLEPGGNDPKKGDKQRQRKQKCVARFLESMAEPILRAGKAIGLLRVLGVAMTSSDIPELDCFFGDLLQGGEHIEAIDSEGATWSRLSVESLSRVVDDTVSPRCTAADALLMEILVGECGIRDHLQNLEDLLLMRRWDIIGHFADVVFTKIDSQQPWTDFHTLNTAFRDVIEANASSAESGSIQTSLIRLSYRSPSRNRSDNLSVTILDGLAVEYAVPFPLTYVFQPTTLQAYSDTFVFLLKIRRAKYMLEMVSMKANRDHGQFRPFYAMRGRLTWFTNTFLDFLTANVIQTLVTDFHEIFKTASSLDDMERLHSAHSEKIRIYCLLRPQEASLRRALLSILDLALYFMDSFIAFAGSNATTHGLSTSVYIKQHRSRRQRRHARNIVGFSASLLIESDSDDEDEAENAVEPSFSYGASVSYEDEDFHARMERMSSELDGLVKFFRRGVENLASLTDTALFSILVFALDDWDS